MLGGSERPAELAQAPSAEGGEPLAGGNQPRAGRSSPRAQRPPVKCAPSLLVRDALGTQENTRLRAAARAWHTPASAEAARNTGNKRKFPSERKQLEPKLIPRK